MEIIQYVKWTIPGEKDKFFNLAVQYKEDADLKKAIMEEFHLKSFDATTLMIRFRNKIKQVRNQNLVNHE